ncbi:amylo-alpha-1,6-glucosidase [Botrimarina sp.]|uniref:amylo-alpha-1,6-glucosidase n=1 Tax=Botrimarina sp. TaxID=2795802 RepID=UPI0032ED121A
MDVKLPKATQSNGAAGRDQSEADEIIRFKDQLYIAVGSQRTSSGGEVLKRGDTFAVVDKLGEIGVTGISEHGVYHRGTRHLSRWELFVGGSRPMLLNTTMDQENSHLVVQMTTADLPLGDGFVIPHGALHIFRTLRLEHAGFREELKLTNYTNREISLPLEYRFAADFVDIFEVRGAPRKRRGELLDPVVADHSVALPYAGVDDRRRQTVLRLGGQCDLSSHDKEHFRLRVDLPPGASQVVEVKSRFENVANDGGSVGGIGLAEPSRDPAGPADGDFRTAEIATPNERFNEWLSRSLADLRMLTTETPYGLYPYAGVPWFSTPFGRDALITALETLWVWPQLARGTLEFLAAHQANSVDPETEAEPGKILHEVRDGEMAATGEVPFRLYYGTVDSTPLFVMLSGAYYRRTGDLNFIRSIWTNIQRALNWIDQHGDSDGDGFVEYQSHNERGLIHQCWKDSHDSVFHSDGRPATGPIAVSEVQAYVYQAKNDAAELAVALGEERLATRLREEARGLKQRFNERFWSSPIQTFALALDGDKQPCEVRSSNSGHLLFCGIADEAYAPATARTLMSEAGFSGWGIRTIAKGEANYNPMSYHNGTIWPHDTAIGGAGLARYGFRDAALRVLNGLYEAALVEPLHRLPELFCGFERLPGHGPTLWPVACSPQAWAAGAGFVLLQALLGLKFDAPNNRVSLERPMLPNYLQRLSIRGLRVGSGAVDLVVHRHPRDVGLYVERKEGDVEVVVIN